MDNGVKEVDILLVEDNASDAELTIRALRKNNFADNLVWLRDGAEALDFLFAAGAYRGRNAADLPNVILLDLRMPKLGGMEVLRKIKEDERTRAIPVVVLTSSREDRDVTESYRLGVNSYVSKPVEFEAFARTVAALRLYWLRVNRPPVREK